LHPRRSRTHAGTLAACVLKIAIVGPESSGKTTLAEILARLPGAALVPEVARAYLEGLGRPYEEPDLLVIARAQVEREEQMARDKDVTLLVCDTDLITIRIWSEEKYGPCDPWIARQSEGRHYDLWMLCMPDIPWEADPLRENPHDRDRLFTMYRDTLDRLQKPYVIIAGDREERVATATAAIHRSFAEHPGG